MATRPLDVTIVGGGPAGLYFGILMKKADPRHEVRLFERNKPDDTFGFGVVFSDAAIETLEREDAVTYAEIQKRLHRWDDIHIHFQGEKLVSTGHGFSGISRQALLEVLEKRAKEMGVEATYRHEVPSVESLKASDVIVAADGANSTVRGQLAANFGPQIDWRPNRFAWFGTTFPFPAFTFYFKHDKHGLWRIHAYRYDQGHSTFIVETTEATWRSAGLENADEEAGRQFVEELFRNELQGHPLLKNRSLWRAFPIIRNAKWSHENVVLIGDAAHTTHFSIGSGTKLAMEDAAALRDALVSTATVREGLAKYEATRRPIVESFQRAAQVSLTWFEDTERYLRHPPIQFGFSLLTRSFRVTHGELKQRDPAYVAKVDEWFAKEAARQTGVSVRMDPPPPPMFTPYKLRDLLLPNRVVVSPMCQYSATEGTVDDWHLVHLGSRAIGGAGLVISEMTDVSQEGRITPGCAGMYRDEHVPAWKRIVDFVHKYTPAKIGMQLGHAGRKGSQKVPWQGDDVPLDADNWPIMGPSSIAYLPHLQAPKEMTRADMEKVRDDHVRSAQMADRAGFDLLELHFAHGYLLATFISPLTNRRTDAYGGTLENRLRFPLEIFDAVRKVWPARKPISVRISANDWAPGGFDATQAVELGRLFKSHGCDVIDVSAGQTVAHAKPVYGRQFQTPFSERVRLEAGIPTMAVGNISSFTDVNTILAAGRADLAVLARAHLFDPYWARHAAAELGYDYEWPDPYKSLRRYNARFK